MCVVALCQMLRQPSRFKCRLIYFHCAWVVIRAQTLCAFALRRAIKKWLHGIARASEHRSVNLKTPQGNGSEAPSVQKCHKGIVFFAILNANRPGLGRASRSRERVEVFKLFGLTIWAGFARNAFRYDLNPGSR